MMLRCANATHDPSPITSRNRTQAQSPTMRLRRRVWWYHAGRNSSSRMSCLLGSMRRLLLLLRAAGRAGYGRDRRRTLDGAEHIDHFHGAGVVLGGRRRRAGVVLVAAF